MTVSVEEAVTKSSTKTSLLQPVQVTENELKNAKDCPTKYENQDMEFTHDFIQRELDTFNLSLDGCDKCSQIVSHFTNPKALLDHFALDKIKWIPFPHCKLLNPAPNLTTPLWEPQNAHLQLNHERP